MAISLQPENTPAPSQPSQEGVTPQLDSQSQPIQPTNQPAQVPTDQSNYITLLEASIREQNQRIQSQQDEIRQIKSAPASTTQPVVPAQADPTTFFNNPQGVLAEFEDRIKTHFADTVKPLQDFVRGMKGDGTPYGNLKAQYANDPRFASQLANPKISIAVDKILEGQQSVTPDIMAGAIIQAAGMEVTGQLDSALVRAGVPLSQFSSSNSQQNQPPQNMRITPPHVPPTPPAAPITQPATTAPEPLTELQKRMARERGQTEEQYREWLNVPASNVVGSKIGRPNG
jgi:hypothetical protein